MSHFIGQPCLVGAYSVFSWSTIDKPMTLIKQFNRVVVPISRVTGYICVHSLANDASTASRNGIHGLENRRQFQDSDGDRRRKVIVSIDSVRIAKNCARIQHNSTVHIKRVLTASADGSRWVSVASGGRTGTSSASGAVVPLAVFRAAVPPWPSSLLFGTSVFATKGQPTRCGNGENASGRHSTRVQTPRKPRIPLTGNE